MTKSNGLIVFIKNPEIGKAKTRVAEEVGDDKAMEVYLSLLDITKTVVESVDASRYLYYSHFVNNEDGWAEQLYTKDLQVDGDLGDKMHDAFSKALLDNEKVVIVGSDCPYISPEIIDDAFEALEDYDTVIGPAEDGGYYLIGMKKMIDEVFFNMEWSVDNVRSETIKRIKSKGFTHTLLPELSDIDYWRDWEKYLESTEKKV